MVLEEWYTTLIHQLTVSTDQMFTAQNVEGIGRRRLDTATLLARYAMVNVDITWMNIDKHYYSILNQLNSFKS